MEESQVNLKKLLTPVIAVSLLGISAAPVARAQDEVAEEAPQPASTARDQRIHGRDD
jgi:hypothetical protein